MKNKTLYLLSIILFFLCPFQGQSSQKTIDINNKQNKENVVGQAIKKFYVSYAANFSNGFDAKNDTLLIENMTQNLIAKISRMRSATESNPIIRAQDFNLNDLSSFDVKHLKGSWYIVSYALNVDNGTRIEIPVKTINVDGKILIDYITPEWNNSLYGDKLLAKQKYSPIKETSSPLEFLKTFYRAYTVEYCNMPIDLSNRLDNLCKKYFTKNALEQIRTAKINEENPDYDLLIDYSDFDILWLPTLSFTYLKGNTYKVSYTKWQNMVTNIYVSIIKKDGSYFIDRICVDRGY